MNPLIEQLKNAGYTQETPLTFRHTNGQIIERREGQWIVTPKGNEPIKASKLPKFDTLKDAAKSVLGGKIK